MAAQTEGYNLRALRTLSKQIPQVSQDRLNTILNYVHTKRGDIVDVLTQEYRTLASKERRMVFNLDGKHVSSKEYLSYMSKLYEDDDTFGCLERATNSYEAQLYVYNVLQSIYALLYPNTLRHFSEFVTHVVNYMKHVQHGHICVFDGTHEILPSSYFENLMVGCFLAVSYMKAGQCRSERTLISKLGYRQSRKEYKVLMAQFKKSCSFFDTIDTATFQRNLRNKMGYAYDLDNKGGRRRSKRKSRTNRCKSVKKIKRNHRITRRKRR
jgi:hypothetical protein